MKAKHGIHLIGDLFGCDFSINIKDKDPKKVIIKVQKEIIKVGLHVLGNIFHVFGPDSFTVAYILAESHITIHTRPESNYVSVDVFVCNYSQDNSQLGERIFNYLVDIFRPIDVKKIKVNR